MTRPALVCWILLFARHPEYHGTTTSSPALVEVLEVSCADLPLLLHAQRRAYEPLRQLVPPVCEPAVVALHRIHRKLSNIVR
jgi:hypothetical protein